MNWNSNQIPDLFIIWESRKPHRISGVRLLLSIHSVFHWRVSRVKKLSANSNKNLGTFILKSTDTTRDTVIMDKLGHYIVIQSMIICIF